ncbi:MAG: hypothetical protein WD401_01950 [Thermomicrobiaceae bacterium]
MEVKKLLGASVKQRGDARVMTGRADHTDDIRRSHFTHMGVVRSPYGDARIADIDTRQAESLHGVVAGDRYQAEDTDRS